MIYNVVRKKYCVSGLRFGFDFQFSGFQFSVSVFRLLVSDRCIPASGINHLTFEQPAGQGATDSSGDPLSLRDSLNNFLFDEGSHQL